MPDVFCLLFVLVICLHFVYPYLAFLARLRFKSSPNFRGIQIQLNLYTSILPLHWKSSSSHMNYPKVSKENSNKNPGHFKCNSYNSISQSQAFGTFLTCDSSLTQCLFFSFSVRVCFHLQTVTSEGHFTGLKLRLSPILRLPRSGAQPRRTSIDSLFWRVPKPLECGGDRRFGTLPPWGV